MSQEHSVVSQSKKAKKKKKKSESFQTNRVANMKELPLSKAGKILKNF